MISDTLNIRIKFISGLVLFTLLLGLSISITMYFHFNSIMKSQVSQRSRMLLAQSNAVQDYVKTILRPEMFKIMPPDSFVLKAMSSSYISREIMARLNITDDITYHYRRVAKNARNRESSPDAFEEGLIDYFNANRSVLFWEDDSVVNNVEYHLVARPIEFVESCMNCHDKPEDAPKELIKIYGDKWGFNNKIGEVGGVVIAGFPVDMIKNPVKEVTLQYLSLYLLGILFFAIIISLFFDRLVMKNLHNLTHIFKTRFSGSQEQGIIEKMEKKDEIEGLIEGVDELALCLSDARDKLQSVFEGISDPLLLIDEDCRILKANRGSFSILSNSETAIQEEELKVFLGLNKDNDDGSPMAPESSAPDLIERVTQTGELVGDEIKTEDGRYFKIVLYPLSRQEGLNLRMVLSAREITLEKDMEANLQQAERLSSIGRMAAGMAHEINNPLGVISCYADLVRDAVSEPEVVSDVDMILKKIANVQKIVQNLLNLARPKQVLSGKSSINSIVDSVTKVFNAKATSKGVVVSYDLADDLPDVRCDAWILEQILTNIWLNAFDAVEESCGETKISTRLADNGHEVLLCVEDDGPGIAEELIEQIFDPFFTTKKPGKGTGLGLAVVYGFISELGGRIEVKQGDKTGFWLFFPAV